MENLGLHKQKLIAVIIAAVGAIAHLLPWWSVSLGGFANYSINGLHKLGILSFIAFLAAGAIPFFLGNKAQPFSGQDKTATLGAFGAAAGAAIITLLANMKYLSFGIFLAIAAAVIGVLYIMGKVKMPEGNKPA